MIRSGGCTGLFYGVILVGDGEAPAVIHGIDVPDRVSFNESGKIRLLDDLRDKFIDLLLVTHHLKLDGAVGEVLHRADNIESKSELLCGVAESNTLNPTVEDDSFTCHSLSGELVKVTRVPWEVISIFRLGWVSFIEGAISRRTSVTKVSADLAVAISKCQIRIGFSFSSIS